MYIRTVYKEVAIRSEKKGKCAVCGKTAIRREKFWQTINPFNKTKDGIMKDRSDIIKELQVEAQKWMQSPVKHAKCE